MWETYLEFDLSVRNPAANFDNITGRRLIHNPYAHCFKEASLATTGSMAIEHKKLLGQASTLMTALTSKHGNLLPHFDNINEGNRLADFNSTPVKQMLSDNHTEAANKGKTEGQVPLEHVFGFCRTFKKITTNLGFHLTLETTDQQNIIFTTIATDINVTINSLYLVVPVLIPSTDTQVMFKESNKYNYASTYDSS